MLDSNQSYLPGAIISLLLSIIKEGHLCARLVSFFLIIQAIYTFAHHKFLTCKLRSACLHSMQINNSALSQPLTSMSNFTEHQMHTTIRICAKEGILGSFSAHTKDLLEEQPAVYSQY